MVIASQPPRAFLPLLLRALRTGDTSTVSKLLCIPPSPIAKLPTSSNYASSNSSSSGNNYPINHTNANQMKSISNADATAARPQQSHDDHPPHKSVQSFEIQSEIHPPNQQKPLMTVLDDVVINAPTPPPDVNAPIEGSRTALLLASELGHAPVVRELLRHPRIDVNRADESGWPPLLWATHNDHVDVMSLLLERNDVDVNAPGGTTALHRAVSNGSMAAVLLLLREGRLDPGLENDGGLTPLMMSVDISSRISVVGMLLRHPKVNLTNRNGISVLHVAGHWDVFKRRWSVFVCGRPTALSLLLRHVWRPQQGGEKTEGEQEQGRSQANNLMQGNTVGILSHVSNSISSTATGWKRVDDTQRPVMYEDQTPVRKHPADAPPHRPSGRRVWRRCRPVPKMWWIICAGRGA